MTNLSPRPDNGPDGLVVFFLLLGALTVRILPLTFGTTTTDILLYEQQATPIVQMQNIYYVKHAVFPYTPVSMFYPALCYQLSGAAGIPFHLVMKFFALLSDAGIVAALYVLGCRFFGRRQALFGAVLYALNPASILIGSCQGNIMPFVVLLMLTSYFYFSIDREKNLAVSGLLLGLAVGWRSFPILLLPLFLVSMRDLSWGKKARFTAYVILPSVLSLIPFWVLDPESLRREIGGYNGVMHHGIFAVMKGLWLLSFKDISEVRWHETDSWAWLFPYSKSIFLSFWALVTVFFKRVSLLNKSIAVFLAFYVLYAGVAPQYLIWVLPFLLLLRKKTMYYAYAGAVTYALAVFYLTFFRGMLFGRLPAPEIDQVFFFRQYVISEALYAAVCVAMIFILLFRKGPSQDAPKGEGALCRLL